MQIRKVLLGYLLDREDLPLCEIAAREGIRIDSAYRIVREIKAEWSRENELLRDQVCDRIHRGILETRRIAKEMLAKSREQRTVETVTNGAAGQQPRASVTRISQHGDAAILGQINKTYELEAKLFGVNAPDRLKHEFDFDPQAALQAFTKLSMEATRIIGDLATRAGLDADAEKLKVKTHFLEHVRPMAFPPPARVRSTARQEAN